MTRTYMSGDRVLPGQTIQNGARTRMNFIEWRRHSA